VENTENLGFGGGFNAGLRAGCRPFVLTLNSDARPVGTAYRRLLDHCASNERLGAVTPRTVDRNGRSLAQMPPEPPAWQLVAGCLPLAWRLAFPKLYWPKPGPPEILEWLPSMCATIFRREALQGIGAFDASYFLGWEEWDLTRRLRAADWQIAIHQGAEVLHEGQGSTPKELSPWRARHGRESRCYHLRKYHGLGWFALGRIASRITDVYVDLRARTGA